MDYEAYMFQYEQKRAYNTFARELLIDTIMRKNEQIKELEDRIKQLKDNL